MSLRLPPGLLRKLPKKLLRTPPAKGPAKQRTKLPAERRLRLPKTSASTKALCLGLGIGAFVGSTASGQCELNAEQRVFANKPRAGALFGSAVAATNGWLAVGANGGVAIDLQGAVSLYRVAGPELSFHSSIRADDSSTRDFFGSSAAFSGDTLVVGAPAARVRVCDERREGGAVYLFEWIEGVWKQRQTIVAPNETKSQFFGGSLDYDGEWLVVGDQFASNRVQGSGLAHVYRRESGRFRYQQTLEAPDARDLDRFGFSVALDRDLIVIGAIHNPLRSKGAAYIYRHASSWDLEGALYGEFWPGPLKGFGRAVEVGDGRVFVTRGPSNSDWGAVLVHEFIGGNWTVSQTLATSGSTPNFGESLDLQGDLLAVGHSFAQGEFPRRLGKVFLYRNRPSGFSLEAELVPRNTFENEFLGARVACQVDAEGRTLVFAGSPNSGMDPHRAGSFSNFEVPPILVEGFPRTPFADDELTLRACGGKTNGPVLIAVVVVDGVRTFFSVAIGRFAGRGTFERQFIVPPGLEGLTIAIEAYGLDRESGRIARSQRDRLHFR